MIVLDTNVVSEAMRPVPDPDVLGWLNAQSTETLYLSSVTLAELLFGIGALPARAEGALGPGAGRLVGPVSWPGASLRPGVRPTLRGDGGCGPGHRSSVTDG